MGILQKRAKDGFLEGIGIVGERGREERERDGRRMKMKEEGLGLLRSAKELREKNIIFFKKIKKT